MDMAQLFSAIILQYTQRGSGGNVQVLPSLALGPWEIVTFESRGGARLGRGTERLLPGPDPPTTIKLNFINV